ncbi:helix-turn-helix domain-containing protein [Paracoccus benzoatiresistens]|uniref:Helix-turn-helix domain-containing protein n=1 Tax=Paracoccus benzoatiresistens TaxID=2997341 RepID=A0ABT4J7N8_9RHOB|nr:helix-turn-helix domain-containing protein [Paracoccus sp. EF6]MCZ0962919.1 helix-turn-helix domain-containing protein [Paracoccus sp. EF6]
MTNHDLLAFCSPRNRVLASHLTLPERRIVAPMLQRKISVAQIAVELGQHRSTIHPEIRGNVWHDDEVPMGLVTGNMNAPCLACPSDHIYT